MVIVRPARGEYIAPSALIGESDGRIVVAGTYYSEGGLISDFAMVGLSANGRLDARFGGGDGLRRTDFVEIDIGRDIARLPDGRYAVAGTARCGVFCDEDPDSEAVQDFTLALSPRRKSRSGGLVTGGRVITKWRRGNGLSMAFSVVAQADSRIVALGGAGSKNGDFAAARYDPAAKTAETAPSQRPIGRRTHGDKVRTPRAFPYGR